MFFSYLLTQILEDTIKIVNSNFLLEENQGFGDD